GGPGGCEAARRGGGVFSLVRGEPGIGKPRLAERVAEEASARGFCVLWGRCWESGGAPAYWPWVQVLRSALRGRDPTTLASATGRAITALGQLLPARAHGSAAHSI